ncbi:MAG: four helix bundle protein [Planctomycetota bacterium]|nr:four helix bundle protein [Planctomycetota bacterium]
MAEQDPANRKVYDLEERTAKFGEAVVGFAKAIPISPVTHSLIDQLVRSGTSVGANYCEADESGTRKDFRHRISICKREAKETKHWLRMLVAAAPQLKPQAALLWKEARELQLIFAAVHRNTKV